MAMMAAIVLLVQDDNKESSSSPSLDAPAAGFFLGSWTHKDAAATTWIGGAVATVAVAWFLHRYYWTVGASSDETTRRRKRRNNESRLLRQQFGSLPVGDDLVLQEEEEKEKAPGGSSVEAEKRDASEADADDEDAAPSLQAPSRSTSEPCRQQPSSPRTSALMSSSADATNSSTTNRPSASATSTRPPSFLQSTNDHPGLAAFGRWCDVEASLFRIYTIPRRDGTQDETTVPPYNPSSRRGHVPINLRVTNNLSNKVTIAVYWIDFQGRYVPKGRIPPGGTWRQTTWIDHPWVFCAEPKGHSAGQEKETTLLHYIPYRVIPTTREVPTVDDEDDRRTGVHRFAIVDACENNSPYVCGVRDPVFPHPPNKFAATPHAAVLWALLHCVRMNHVGWAVLQTYLQNILLDDDEQANRRQIRTANRTFGDSVWNTPARGVLLAAGFVEHGAYVELGTAQGFAGSALERLLSDVVGLVAQWRKRAQEEEEMQPQQPDGADGSGRAGYRW